MRSYATLAPAKVNLFLHVSAPDKGGYHPLESLVAFANFGDRVVISHDVTKYNSDFLTLSGRFVNGLTVNDGNLICRAAEAFKEVTGLSLNGVSFHLEKNLPVASGLGGGSADAGAALRLLRHVFAPDMADGELEGIAASLGADGAMCLWARPCLARGYGERLSPVTLPTVPAVLVNPGVECPTGEVYRAYDEMGHFSQTDQSLIPATVPDFDALISGLDCSRNDLQIPAIAGRPVIGRLLSDLTEMPEARLVRMSGSGASCFALCQNINDTHALVRRISATHPSVWVKAVLLNSASPTIEELP